MIKEIVIVAIIYYWFLTSSNAEVIKPRACRRSRELALTSEVTEISIEPCHSGENCEIHKGTNATVTVRFTPSKVSSASSGCKIKSTLVWVSKIDMRFGNISSNACDYMKCPLKPNIEQVFNATLFISTVWPSGTYPLKLRLYKTTGSSKKVILCQLFKVHLTDQPTTDVMYK